MMNILLKLKILQVKTFDCNSEASASKKKSSILWRCAFLKVSILSFSYDQPAATINEEIFLQDFMVQDFMLQDFDMQSDVFTFLNIL